jgi:leucyl/phenylalanyl-tRNA--protein transferase
MPIHAGPTTVLAWWSPDPRGIIPLDGLRVTRSLRRSCARYRVTFDVAFEAVIDACADRSRPGRWIDDQIREAYVGLHRSGWAHSVEAWSQDGALAGGLYGVAIGGLFAGESMFHHQRDASKVALVALVEELRGNEKAMLDVQWLTPHLATLGGVEIPRSEYLARLPVALRQPLPRIFQEPS